MAPKSKLMQTVQLGQRPVTDTVPINFIDPVQPASPDEPVTVPGDHLDWPEITTVPGELLDDDPCPWKQSGFL